MKCRKYGRSLLEPAQLRVQVAAAREPSALLEHLGKEKRAVHVVLARQVALQREPSDRGEPLVDLERLVGVVGEQVVKHELGLAERVVRPVAQELAVVED